MNKIITYFTKQEIILWFSSTILIFISFILFDKTNYLTLFASIIGVTSLIFNTTNLIPSTISVTISFLAVYLTFRRSPYFDLAYALNDIVLYIFG